MGAESGYRILEEKGIEIGDRIKFEYGGRWLEGIVMPRHAFTSPHVVVVKLNNGYNIGINIENIKNLKVIEKCKKRVKITRPVIFCKDCPKIGFLSTGGTIASSVEYHTGAVRPAYTAEELVYSIPGIEEMCIPKAKVVFNILSEDMKPENWITLAKEIYDMVYSGVDGIVIPHGTDTMAYTSAALSFILQNPPVPILLVGAQRSSDRPSSDATENLMACIYAIKEHKDMFTDAERKAFNRPLVAMHTTTSDGSVSFHLGTKVRKMHSTRRDAFKSINIRPLAYFKNWKIHIDPEIMGFLNTISNDGEFCLHSRIETKVTLIYTSPFTTEDDLLYAANRYKGLVIAGTGMGHIASNLIDTIATIVMDGIPVVVTTQCLNGVVNFKVYTNGRKLLKAGAISGADMLPETALVKLMWVLGRTEDMDEIRRMMETNIAGEFYKKRGYYDYASV